MPMVTGSLGPSGHMLTSTKSPGNRLGSIDEREITLGLMINVVMAHTSNNASNSDFNQSFQLARRNIAA